MVQPRKLSEEERAVLERVLSGGFDGARELRSQIEQASVTGGLPTLLDLAVHDALPARCSDGPVPVRAMVEGPAGDAQGEVLVWVTGGFLSGLEFAWVTDDTPAGMPPPDRIRIE